MRRGARAARQAPRDHGRIAMFEPVWLGNHIVPRWEAIVLVLGIPAAVIVGIVAVGILFWWALFSPQGH